MSREHEQLDGVYKNTSGNEAGISRRDVTLALFLATIFGGAALACTKKAKDEPAIEVIKGPTFEAPSSREQLNDGKVLVLFSADWCQACPSVKEFLKKNKAAIEENGYTIYEFYFVGMIKDKPEPNPLHSELMKEYEVRAIPTVLVLNNGFERMQLVGLEEISSILTGPKKIDYRHRAR